MCTSIWLVGEVEGGGGGGGQEQEGAAIDYWLRVYIHISLVI